MTGIGRFYKEMLEYWQELRPDVQPHEEIIWNNKNIIVNGETLFYRKWYEAGLIHVKDLLDDKGNLLTLNEVNEKYGINLNILNYTTIVKAIPKEWLENNVNHTKIKRICQDHNNTKFTI